ncbi:MAG: hypothetical protein IPH58_13010 [Sphingobacteriales bacterium]|nr:hypothetical protein [Sphingobacteriales bacterium]
MDDEIEVGITLEITETLPSLVCGFNLISGFGYPILRANYNDYNNLETLTIGLHSLKFRIPPYFLAVGNYTVDFDIAIPFKKKINNNEISLSFGILAKSLVGNKYTIENSPMYNSQIRTNLFQEECLVKK